MLDDGKSQTTSDVVVKYVARNIMDFYYISVIIFLYKTDVTQQQQQKNLYQRIQTGRFIFEMKSSLSIDYNNIGLSI